MNSKKVFEITYGDETESFVALVAAETMSKAVLYVEDNMGAVLYCSVVANGANVSIV